MRNAPLPIRTLTFVLLLLAIGVGAGCRGGDHPPPAQTRRIVAERWTVVFNIRSSPTDSSLLLPFRPVTSSDGLFLADFIGNKILHYDRNGHLRWQFGREGHGPDEFKAIRDLKVDGAGRVWALDQGNRRIMILNRDGTVHLRIPLTGVSRMPQGVVPLSNGEAVVLVDATDSPFVRIDSTGSVLSKAALPWAGYRDLTYLAGQFTTAAQPSTSDWVAAFLLGDGFFAFHGLKWRGYRGWYMEHVDFPDVETVQTNTTRETRMTARPIRVAQAITMSPSRIYVLFAGSTPQARQIVDSYSIGDGAYRGSYRLPMKVEDIAWAPEGFYVLFNDPYPNLSLIQPSGIAIP